jgi:hypothetical protein
MSSGAVAGIVGKGLRRNGSTRHIRSFLHTWKRRESTILLCPSRRITFDQIMVGMTVSVIYHEEFKVLMTVFENAYQRELGLWTSIIQQHHFFECK